MALIDNVVHEQSTSTGSGNMTIGALNGRQRFSQAFSTGGSDTFYYSILNQSAQEWEIGTGSLSDANTLVRDTVLASSNSGSAVNFSAGTKDVVNGIPKSDAALTSSSLAQFAATTSAELAGVISDETGSGALVFGTSPGFTTAANPASDDGATLGTTSLKWSDFFLASGGVINFNSDDVTITHSSNKLTFAGASSGYIFSDGNVGIGTTSPSQRLHVLASNASPDGIVVSNSGSGASRFWINNTTEGTDSQVLLRSTSGGSPLYWSMAIDGSDSHKFKIDNNVTAGGTTRFTIDSSGNVGIGTTSPLTKGHVKSASSIDGLTIEALNRSSIWMTASNGVTYNWLIQQGVNSTSDLQVLASASGGGTPTQSILTLRASGNVGIGTTSPSTTLHVNGPVRTASYTVATLPAAGTVGAGARAYVTDANAMTFASTVAGGGANAVPVYSDGTNWKIG